MRKVITLTSFRSFSEIAVGGTSVVFKATQKSTNQQVAIKLIEITSVKSIETALDEVAICKTIHFPYIIEYFGCMRDDKYIYQIMEFVGGGSLLNWINEKQRLDFDEASRIFCQLISSLKYLHFARGIAHRDIKLENILLDDENNIKIIDFGFVRQRCPLMKTQCGTLPYSAPEIIKHSLYTLSVDIWSSGVVLYAMLTGTMPFKGGNAEALIHEILSKDPVFPSSMDKSAVDLISKLLEKDPKNRITLREIENHPWLAHSPYKEFLSDKYIASHAKEEELDSITGFDFNETDVANRIAAYYGLARLPPLNSPFNLLDVKTSFSASIKVNKTKPNALNFAVFRNLTQPKFVTPSLSSQAVMVNGIRFRSNQVRASMTPGPDSSAK